MELAQVPEHEVALLLGPRWVQGPVFTSALHHEAQLYSYYYRSLSLVLLLLLLLLLIINISIRTLNTADFSESE